MDKTEILVTVTEAGDLELPIELREQLSPGDRYLVSISEDTILLKKSRKPLTLQELRRRVEALGPDPDEMSLDEISQLVKEVRRESRSQP